MRFLRSSRVWVNEGVCVCVCRWVWCVCMRGIAGVPVLFSSFELFSFSFSCCCHWSFPWLLSLSLSLSFSLSLDNNFAYDTTISGIRRCWVLALETVIVAEGHVLLWRQHLILFHVLHVVGVRQAAYVVIWWICKVAKKRGENCLN